MSSHLFHSTTHILPAQHIREYPNATATHTQEAVFKLAIKHYTPISNPQPSPNDITIIAAHALGFPKELYEPLWDDLLTQSERHGFGIRGIWIADSAHEGASGVLNENLMGDDASWFDHSRDLLHMVNHFRQEFHRPIVGVGHSRGACELVNLSLIHPRLLSTLVLIEPFIQAEAPPGPNAAGFATMRPDFWPSREIAEQKFRKSQMYSRWDHRVLDKYLEHGLRSVPTALYPASASASVPSSAVTLTTTKHQEAWAYVRPNFEPRSDDLAFERFLSPDADPEAEGKLLTIRSEPGITVRNLPFLRPSVCYIFGKKSPMSSPKLQAEKMSRTGTGVGGSGGVSDGKVTKVEIEAGHLAAMEAVGRCAEVSAEWLGRWLRGWKNEEETVKRRGSRKSERGMMVVSEEWKELMRVDPRSLRPIREKL